MGTKKPVKKDTVDSVETLPINSTIKTVVIKNVGTDYQTINVKDKEQILYPKQSMEVPTDKPEKLKAYLDASYGRALQITIK